MSTFEDVVALVREHSACRKDLSPASTLQGDVGMHGDDLDELVEALGRRFRVDVASYLPYFHTGEEGPSPGALLFRPPNERVEEIPITLQLLVDAVERGSWPVEYPAHRLPERRYDVWVDHALVVLLLAGMAALFVRVVL